VALKILKMFPVLPDKYLSPLTEIATGEGKKYRRKAQDVLETTPNVLDIAAPTLEHSKQVVRAAGAAWIGRIGDVEGVPFLVAALAKEKREFPTAAILGALHNLGHDISAHLTQQTLGQAAKKGLAEKVPASMSKYSKSLPACRWADGVEVDPDVIRWWVVLACKLDDPLGAGLIPIYVSLLSAQSCRELGSHVLQRWVSPNGHRVISRGLLALTVGAPGHEVFKVAQRFLRGRRKPESQVEALLTAALGNNDPAAIGLVLSVARQHKQKSVRLLAAELAESIAERRGWSLDELDDRTIPTAGFSVNGFLRFNFDRGVFTGHITRTPKTAVFTIALSDPDGKPIKKLPKPASHYGDLARKSRTQLATSKRELSHVADEQTSRLFEAMCLGRAWASDEWRECLFNHPVMRHLIASLVWATGDGESSYRLFRPTVDGELLDVDDEAVELATRVWLAHQVVITPDEASRWLRHLAAYKVPPLFDQLSAITPQVAAGADRIGDRLGWLSDTNTIRKRALKRGFVRRKDDHGVWFGEYHKTLPSSGIKVVIEFTGWALHHDNTPAAVEHLLFEREGRRMKLTDVPPILLAAAYSDYTYIAEAGVIDLRWARKNARGELDQRTS